MHTTKNEDTPIVTNAAKIETTSLNAIAANLNNNYIKKVESTSTPLIARSASAAAAANIANLANKMNTSANVATVTASAATTNANHLAAAINANKINNANIVKKENSNQNQQQNKNPQQQQQNSLNQTKNNPNHQQQQQQQHQNKVQIGQQPKQGQNNQNNNQQQKGQNTNQRNNNNNNNKNFQNKNQANKSGDGAASAGNNGQLQSKSKHQNGGGHFNKHHQQQQHNANQNQQSINMQQQATMNTQPQADRKFTGRCRLFVGNLPADMTESEFKELFTKFGEIGEVFLNTQRSFGFIKLDTRLNAEHAKQELDGVLCKSRNLRVRFASHGAAVKVKHLSPYVSNEYLEQAFSQFGPVERAVCIVDDKGRPTGEGIVEFERKPSAMQCITRCAENCFLLTSYPRPIVVEPLEQKDEEDGLPEKSIVKNPQYYSEREIAPHFAQHSSFEQEIALKWIEFYELEKQINEEAKKRIEQAKEILEYEIEQRLMDQKTLRIKEDLMRKQEELQRIEEMRKGGRKEFVDFRCV